MEILRELLAARVRAVPIEEKVIQKAGFARLGRRSLQLVEEFMPRTLIPKM
jgi:hypothetical protein